MEGTVTISVNDFLDLKLTQNNFDKTIKEQKELNRKILLVIGAMTNQALQFYSSPDLNRAGRLMDEALTNKDFRIKYDSGHIGDGTTVIDISNLERLEVYERSQLVNK